jgi:hypothetical protein
MIIGKKIKDKAQISILLLVGFTFLVFLNYWFTDNNNILIILIVVVAILVSSFIYQTNLYDVEVSPEGFILQNPFGKKVQKPLEAFSSVKYVAQYTSMCKLYFTDGSVYLFTIDDATSFKAAFKWDLKGIEKDLNASIHSTIAEMKKG